MKTKYFGLLFTANLTLAINSYSQMTLTGEVRPRSELRNGYQAPMDSVSKTSFFTSQRTKLNFGYTGEKYKIGVAIQDVSVWGTQSQSFSSYSPGAATFLHESWGQYWFTPKLSAKVGRQALSYDDERLFGATQWNQQGRSHDVALIAFEDTTLKLTIHGLSAYNANGIANTANSYSVTNSYKTMQLLWANKKLGPVSASLIFVNVGNQSPSGVNAARCFQTAGTYLEFKKNALFISGRFYDQLSGKFSTPTFSATAKQMQAWMAGVDVQYTLATKFMIGVGMEMMTGQSSTDTTTAYKETNHAFNPLFGTGHKFNGYMDYYFAGSGHNNQGLQDIYLKLKYKQEKCSVGLDAHLFSATANVLDKKNFAVNKTYKTLNSNLGTELDLTFTYNLNKAVALQAGYSYYLVTETTAAVKNIYKLDGTPDDRQPASWAYLMLTFKPNFMK